MMTLTIQIQIQFKLFNCLSHLIFLLFRLVKLKVSRLTLSLSQGWYLTWACLQSWPLYHQRSGLVLAPCPNSCSLVQTSCPFLTIHEDASMAAGDPTFICQGESKEN